MGRTMPSFRIAFEMEKKEWKPFRAALDKSEREEFDDIIPFPSFRVHIEEVIAGGNRAIIRRTSTDTSEADLQVILLAVQ